MCLTYRPAVCARIDRVHHFEEHHNADLVPLSRQHRISSYTISTILQRHRGRSLHFLPPAFLTRLFRSSSRVWKLTDCARGSRPIHRHPPRRRREALSIEPVLVLHAAFCARLHSGSLHFIHSIRAARGSCAKPQHMGPGRNITESFDSTLLAA